MNRPLLPFVALCVVTLLAAPSRSAVRPISLPAGAPTGPAAALPPAAVPNAPAAAAPLALPELAAPQAPTAATTLEALGAAGAPAAPAALDAAYDGGAPAPAALDVDAAGAGAGPGGIGRGPAGEPRVVMILDTFAGPASDAVAARIEKLLDKKIHVVFVTARPEKGENSASSVLVSKLKVRVGNPLIVVSYNGARIAAHSSRAENPKGLVGDLPGFAAGTVDWLRKIYVSAKAKLGWRGKPKEFGAPSLESPLVYGVELPKGADARQAASLYNETLDGAGYQYRAEALQRAGGREALVFQSETLALNTPRVFQALYAQFPHLQPSSPHRLQPSEVQVLADSNKASGFLSALPGKGYRIHPITDEASLLGGLNALLGEERLEKIKVVRSQLRSYTEWVKRREKYGAGRGGRGGLPPAHALYQRELNFYRGIILYKLMGELYHSIRKGNYMDATPDMAVERLKAMWFHPQLNGVLISQEMESLRHTPKWKAFQRGTLDTATIWLKGYYKRNFKDYPMGIGEKVVGTMLNLSRDGKNTIKVDYAAPYTGRRYEVSSLPARAELVRDDKGNVLVAHVYRTGSEPYQDEFEDNIELTLLARAMLQGYAKKRADGRWYVNDEPDPRVKVVFHYMTRDLPKEHTIEELEQLASEVTATIEKMNADKEFLAYWQEQEAINGKVADGKAKAKAKAAERAGRSGKKKGK